MTFGAISDLLHSEARRMLAADRGALATNTFERVAKHTRELAEAMAAEAREHWRGVAERTGRKPPPCRPGAYMEMAAVRLRELWHLAVDDARAGNHRASQVSVDWQRRAYEPDAEEIAELDEARHE